MDMMEDINKIRGHPKVTSVSDSHRIQTCNLLIRSQMLYSVELASLLIKMNDVCDSHRIQTCNLLIRSQMLYSVELASLLGSNALFSRLRMQSYCVF